MPSSVSTAFLLFSITLAICGAVTAALILGGAAALFEAILFYRAGVE